VWSGRPARECQKQNECRSESIPPKEIF